MVGCCGTGVTSAVAVQISVLTERLQMGYRTFTEGKFVDSLAHFKHILLCLPLCVANGASEAEEAGKLLVMAREYALALQLEMKRRQDCKDDPVRSAELAAYLSHCNLQSLHLVIALRSAMVTAVKVKTSRLLVRTRVGSWN